MTTEELRNNFKFYFEEYQGSYYDALFVDSILDDLQEELEAKDKAIKEALEFLDVPYMVSIDRLETAKTKLKEAL